MPAASPQPFGVLANLTRELKLIEYQMPHRPLSLRLLPNSNPQLRQKSLKKSVFWCPCRFCVGFCMEPHHLTSSLHLPCYGPSKMELGHFFMPCGPIHELQQPIGALHGNGGKAALRPPGSNRHKERPGHTPRPLCCLFGKHLEQVNGAAHQATSREYSTMATSLMMLCLTASTIFSNCWATSLL